MACSILPLMFASGLHQVHGQDLFLAARADPRLCLPTESCWPDLAKWVELNVSLGGRLVSPGSDLYVNSTIQAQPNMNYVNIRGGASAKPAYAVVAETEADVVAAVRFAFEHRIRVSVKTRGHSYKGDNTAYGSLLVWVAHLRGPLQWHNSYDDGCGSAQHPAAVTTQAGHVWWDVYPEMDRRGVLTTGGNALTVSTSGGYMQGGGHGKMAMITGLAADNLLSARIVTPDGELHDVSECNEPELFWALRGGGGGTFGIVTAATHRLHSAPKVTIGLEIYWPVNNSLEQEFVEQYIRLAPSLPSVPGSGGGWGGDFLTMAGGWYAHLIFLGSDYDKAFQAMRPLHEWFNAHHTQVKGPLYNPTWRVKNKTSFWDWHGNFTDVVGADMWVSGRVMPPEAFAGENATAYAKFLVDTAKEGQTHDIMMLGGAISISDEDNKKTAVPKWMRRAVWNHFTTCGCWKEGQSQGVVDKVVEQQQRTSARLRSLAPNSGCYLNECAYDEPDWQHANWANAYPRLAKTKEKVDPKGIFLCHHCVGSEGRA